MSLPIIIVGGGPVGMSLAMNLDAQGVRSIVVNDDPRPRWHPKGSTQNSRTMEHYRRLGISASLRKLGLPADHPTDVVYYTRLNGWELARIPMPSEAEKMQRVRDAAPDDQVPEPIFRCNQMHVETWLFEHLQTLGNVDARYGWRCLDWTDHGDSVSVEVEELQTGRRETLRGAYLAGCDGGQSAIRRKLGIRYSGERPEMQAFLGGPMVSTYIRSAELYQRIIRNPRWQYWVVNHEIRANIVAVNGKDEFLFNTRLKSADDKPDNDSIARAFYASVGEQIEVEFIGHWTWTAGQALVAERFGQGRVVLAGDAVHLFTPAGGFGMNTGVDDAANLGWKLAAMVQGWGGPRLIESYERERQPVAYRNTGAAKQLGRNIGAVPVGAAIEEQSAAGEAARREASESLAGFGPEFNSLGVQLGVRYDGSPIVAADAGPPPADDTLNYVPSAYPGGRAPHVWLNDRSSLFDHFGRGFTLLRFAGADSAALEAAARKRGVPLKILDVNLSAARGLYERDLALIRPDQHVAWRGDHLPEDCDALLAMVTGW